MMSPQQRDTNMLFGILATKLNLVSQDDLYSAMQDWLKEKSKPIAEILVDQGSLNPDSKSLVEQKVAEHLSAVGCKDGTVLHEHATVDFVTNNPQDSSGSVKDSTISCVTSRGQNDGGSTDTHLRMNPGAAIRFRRARLHARGGLGEVSIAVDNELNREVALKEIQDEFADDAPSRMRFIREAEITGRLEHPGIVPVYGMGQYEDGRPYYAMRFIRGDSLKDAIDRFHSGVSIAHRSEAAEKPTSDGMTMETTVGEGEVSKSSEHHTATEMPIGKASSGIPVSKSLEFRKLLGHLVDVCNAMEYAHSRGVLHRDLKPSNIMLGKYGETLVVDWGLAKPKGETSETSSIYLDLDASLRVRSGSSVAETIMGQAIGTPAFMSPEQAAGQIDLLDATTDVYSLGATLYYLLTGSVPFQGSSLPSVLGSVQKGEFARPGILNKSTPAALEAICLKAMARDLEKRYGRCMELAEDIEHWLADEPVSAWKEPRREQIRRWVKRNRTMVAGSFAAISVLLVSLGVILILVTTNSERLRKNVQKLELANKAEIKARKDAMNERLAAETARDKATAEATRATAVSNFLRGMFEANDPLGFGGWKLGAAAVKRDELTARDLLDRGAAQIENKLKSQPQARAALLTTMGHSYMSVGMTDRARPLVEEAIQLLRESEAPLELAESLETMGWIHHEFAEYIEAEQSYKESLAIREAQLDPSDELVQLSRFHIGWLFAETGEYERAKEILTSVLEFRRQNLDPNDRRIAITLAGLGGVCFASGEEISKVLEYLQEAHKILEDQEGENSFNEGIKIFQQGYFQANFFKDHKKAVELYREAVRLGEKGLGKDHPYLVFGLYEMANSLMILKKYDEAIKVQQRAINLIGHLVTRDNPRMVVVKRQLGDILLAKGETEKAKEIFQECISATKEWIERHPNLGESQVTLSSLYHTMMTCADELGEVDLAIQFCREMIALDRRRVESGEPVRKDLSEGLNWLGDLLLRAHRTQEAVQFYEQDLEISRALLQETNETNRLSRSFDLAYALQDIRQAYYENGELDHALEVAAEQLELWESLAEAKSPTHDIPLKTLEAQYQLGDLLLTVGRYQQSEESFQRGVDGLQELLATHSEPLLVHVWLAYLTESFGDLMVEVGRYQEAIRWFDQSRDHWVTLQETRAVESSTRMGYLKSIKGLCTVLLEKEADPNSNEKVSRWKLTRMSYLRAFRFGHGSKYNEIESLASGFEKLNIEASKKYKDLAMIYGMAAKGILHEAINNDQLHSQQGWIESLNEEQRAALKQVQDAAIESLRKAIDNGWERPESIGRWKMLWAVRMRPEYHTVVSPAEFSQASAPETDQ